MMTIAAMTEIANHAGNEIWPSLPVASRWFDRASVLLAVSVLLTLLSTVAIVWFGIVKEHHWDVLREQASVKIAGLELETAQSKAELAKAHEGIAKANAEIATANQRAAEFDARSKEAEL